jgi:hypothetical protein
VDTIFSSEHSRRHPTLTPCTLLDATTAQCTPRHGQCRRSVVQFKPTQCNAGRERVMVGLKVQRGGCTPFLPPSPTHTHQAHTRRPFPRCLRPLRQHTSTRRNVTHLGLLLGRCTPTAGSRAGFAPSWGHLRGTALGHPNTHTNWFMGGLQARGAARVTPPSLAAHNSVADRDPHHRTCACHRPAAWHGNDLKPNHPPPSRRETRTDASP